MNDSSELSSKVQAVTLTDFPSNHLEQDNEVPRSETMYAERNDFFWP